jgi:threonine dehydrogenase-like Zn-dependent dehydrogenase
MEIVEGGKMALLAGVGPMGLAAINYVLHREDRKPSLLVVTDIDQTRLDRAAGLYTVEFAASRGIDLQYINTSKFANAIESLKATSGGDGYNDIFVFAPVAPVIEQADALLAFDGCLNFFAGPSDPNFKAPLNFYNVHYAYTHVVGTSGGNTDDMKEALQLMSAGLDPAGLVTHIGGINAVIETTLHLPDIAGGKKLIYNHIEMPLTPITDFASKGLTNPVYARLAEICDNHKGLWSTEAEAYLIENSDKL